MNDFLSSKIFPKFYLNTPKQLVYALGEKSFDPSIQVGMIPCDKREDSLFPQNLYTPKFYEILNKNQEIISFKTFNEFPLKTSHNLSKKTWGSWIEKTKEIIKSQVLQKAVLKRTTTFSFEKAINPYDFFFTFQNKNPNVIHFFIQPDEESFFFGGTPETLFLRNKNEVITMALAGTTKLNGRFNKKLMEEFNFVKNQIPSLLSPISTSLKVTETTPKKFHHLQHLYSEIHACIPNTKDEDLIHLIHPTAAIVGYPKIEAQKFVLEIEKEKRDLYASVVGFKTNDSAEFVVGIRSGLIYQNLLHAFCGVGIVDKSKSNLEWNELNTKLKPMKIWMNK
jgi:menaquinone-specific isochorismate synthase